MGAGVYLALILIVGTVLFYSQVSEFASGFFEDLNNSATANQLKPQPTQGQQICDLRLTVRGDITHVFLSFPTAELEWNFGEESTLFGLINNNHGTTESEWIGCSTPGVLSLASVFGGIPPVYFEKISDKIEVSEPQIKTEQGLKQLSFSDSELEELDLISFGTNHYAMEIRLVTGSFFFDKDNTSGMTKTVTIGAGIIPEPIAFEKTFLINNIPRQDYTLQVIMVDQKINGQSSNVPYTVQIKG